jgi:hypothetical protein
VRRKHPFFYDSELLRLQAAALLALNAEANAPAAEAVLQKALDVAQKQQARILALRAASGLMRLRQTCEGREEARVQEARELLSGQLDWFEEGLETEDLKAARDLLA